MATVMMDGFIIGGSRAGVLELDCLVDTTLLRLIVSIC